MLFCSYVIFLLRDQWLIDRFSEAMGAALVTFASGRQQLVANSIEIFISHEKKVIRWRVVAARNLYRGQISTKH